MSAHLSCDPDASGVAIEASAIAAVLRLDAAMAVRTRDREAAAAPAMRAALRLVLPVLRDGLVRPSSCDHCGALPAHGDLVNELALHLSGCPYAAVAEALQAAGDDVVDLPVQPDHHFVPARDAWRVGD